MSKIAVIVPVYKVEKYLKRCVDSILAQTFQDFELILVDDGSTDHCGTICDEYAKEDSRIVTIHQKNGGLSAARNTGINWVFENSNSEWISFIDSDDWVHPRYLECLYNAVCETGTEISVCEYVLTEGTNPVVDENALIPQIWNVEEFYCEKNVIATVAWGKLYRKDCFREIRYPVGKIHEDEFVTYKILFKQNKVVYVGEPLYAYFFNQNGITAAKWSPKKLAAIEAKEQQIRFFQKNHFKHAHNKKAKEYILELISSIEHSNNSQYKKENMFLRIKLIWIIVLYGKFCPISKYAWYYEKVFPKTMGIYWKIQGMLKMRQK